MKTHSLRKRKAAVTLAAFSAPMLALMAWPICARGTVYTWTGSTTSANWSQNSSGTTNWSGNVIPTSGSATQLVFSATANSASLNQDISAPFLLNRITFDGPSFTLNGNSLQFEGSPQVLQNSSNAQRINNNLALSYGLTVGGSGTGPITFGGTITGAAGLAVTYAGAVTFAGAVGGTTGIYSLTTGQPGTTTLSGGNVTTVHDQIFNGAVVLGAATTLTSTSAGTIALNGPVDGAFPLTIASSATTNFAAYSTGRAIGGLIPLSSITVNPSANIGVNSITTTGGQAYLGEVMITAGGTYKTTFTSTGAGDVLFNSEIIQYGVVVNTSGTTTFLNTSREFDSLTTDAPGSTVIGGGGFMVTHGNQIYNDPVIITSAKGFGTNGGSITFANTVDSAFALSFSGTPTTFSAAVGGSIAPGSVSGTTANGVNINGGSVRTTGDQTYKNLMIGADTTLTSTAGGNISISFYPINTAHAMTINTSGTTTFNGAVGSTTPLVSLTTDAAGSTFFKSGAKTTGPQTFNDAVSIGGAGIFASTGSGNISFANTLNGAFDVTVNTSGITFLGGAVGGTAALTGLTTNTGGSTSIDGGSVRTSGAQTYNDPVTVGADVTFSTTTLSTIGFTSTLNGARAVTVNTSGMNTFSGAVGGATPLASLTTNAGGTTAINGGSVTTSGGQTYADAITLGAATTLSSTGGGTISVLGTGSVNGAFPLTISTSGDISLLGAIGGSTALTALSFNGADVTGTSATAGTITQTSGTGTTQSTGTLRATGAGGISLTGNKIKLATVTLDAGPLVINNTGDSNAGPIGGAGGLTKNGNGALTSFNGTYTGDTNINAGSATVTTFASLASSTINVAAGAIFNVYGSLTASTTVNANGTVNFGGSPGAVVLNRPMAALNVAPSVQVTVTPSWAPAYPLVLKPTSLNFTDATAKLDLGNNELITTATLSSIVLRVTSGQIFTSSIGGVLGRLDLGGGQTEVRFTLLGDTNLDGTVDVTDLGNLAGSYGATGGATWVMGDSNYDGAVDVTDLGNLSGAYGSALASGPSLDESGLIAEAATMNFGETSQNVPEPGAAGMLALAGLHVLRRRRR